MEATKFVYFVLHIQSVFFVLANYLENYSAKKSSITQKIVIVKTVPMYFFQHTHMFKV